MDRQTRRTNVLLLSANPKNTDWLRLDEERREIEVGLTERSRLRDNFRLITKVAVRPRDFQRALLDHAPQIVHFSGHGGGEVGLVLEDEIGEVKFVDAEALASLFELFANQLQCVVLNACYSELQAEAIVQHIQYVIGMSDQIGDKAAIEFSVAFYDAIGAGRDIEFAYKNACVAIRMAGIPQNHIPILKKKLSLDSSEIQVEKASIPPQEMQTSISNPQPSPNSKDSQLGQDSHLWKRQKFLQVLGLGGLGIIGTTITIQFIQNASGKSAVAISKSTPASTSRPDSSRELFRYPRLEEFLQAKDWEAANEEAQHLIFDPFLNNQNQTKDFDSFVEYVSEKLSCNILNEIDKLWVKYSDGKFGFSVQSKIYLECDFAAKKLPSYYSCFGKRVGWRVNEEWIDYKDLIFDISAPSGHLPYFSTPLIEGFETVTIVLTPLTTFLDRFLGDSNEGRNRLYFPRLLMSRMINCQIK